MAVNNLTITQDNKSGNVDLLTVYSPIVYIVEADYTLVKPTTIYVDIKDEDDNVLFTFRCIEIIHNIPALTVTYKFDASNTLKAIMEDYDDTEQSLNTFFHLPNVTKTFKLRFYQDAAEIETVFVALQGVTQFGNNPAAVDIYNNTNLTFYGCIGRVVDVYIYNNDIANELKIGEQDLYALDYDDEVFVDYDDYLFKAE